MASLRLHNRTPTDWALDAEGFLLIYEPSVVTDAVFDELFGLQTVAPAVLGWMTGNGNTSLPLVAEPKHWRAHGRAETAERVAKIVRLGWECSLAILPLCVASNGADIRFRSAPPSPEEKNALKRENATGPMSEPRRAWIIARESRLAVTWDFMLGFTASQKKKLFPPGIRPRLRGLLGVPGERLAHPGRRNRRGALDQPVRPGDGAVDDGARAYPMMTKG